MLGYLFEKTSALASSTVDALTATVDYAVDEVMSVPDSIVKGWEEGIMPESPEDKPTDTVEDKPKFPR